MKLFFIGMAIILALILHVLECYRYYRKGYEEGVDVKESAMTEMFNDGERVGYAKGKKEVEEAYRTGYEHGKLYNHVADFTEKMSSVHLEPERRKAIDEVYSRAKKFMSEPYDNNVILKVEKEASGGK